MLKPDTNVGDLDTLTSRLCARMCKTCVYRPGNPVMGPERLEEFDSDAINTASFIPCHGTYQPLGTGPAAICRGFYQRHRHDSVVLLIMAREWGFTEVEPPALEGA